MRYIKKYQLFESNSEDEIVSDLEDIVLEINDLSHWSCQVRGGLDGTRFPSLMELENGRMIRISLSLVDEDYDELDEGWKFYNPPPVVTEVFERAIEYMKMSGWEHYKIYFTDDSHDGNKEINLEQIENFDIYPNETIKIIFTKEPILHRYN
jgi:hypothetical protein